MQKPSQNTIDIVFFILSLIAVSAFIYFISFLQEVTVFNNLKHDIPVGEIHGDIQVGQTFEAEYEGLSGIDVLLATYNRSNSGEFIFHLKSSLDAEKDIYSSRFDIEGVKDNTYFHFEFPKIRNSKRKTFYFYLEAPQSRPGDAITIWSHSQDSYRKGQKIINTVPAAGDLAFKTVYRSGFQESLETFLQKVRQNKPSPLNRKSFYLVLMIVFIATASVFIALLVRYFFGQERKSPF